MNAETSGLVGREEELEHLAAFLAGHDGLPAAMLIEGPAGVGKTTLWRAGVEAAERLGYRVLTCRPTGAEIRLANAALSDLLEPVVADAFPRLPPPQRRALEVALLLRGDDGSPPDARAIAAGFLNVIRQLAGSGPVLVAVDDAQWLDPATADVLQFMARRLGQARVAILASLRTGSTTIRADEARRGPRLEAALGRPAARIKVEPMSLGAVYRLLHARTQLQLNRQMLQRIHETSGGNPFYALELAGVIERSSSRTGPSEPLPLSVGLEQLLASRLQWLPAETADALFVTSATSERTVDLLCGALGRSAESVAMVLRPAENEEIVRVRHGRIEFTHPLFAAAAYQSKDRGERERWHGRIADAARDPVSKARHRALARPGLDAEVAAGLFYAARQAVGRGAPVAASELYLEAIDRLPADRGPDRAAWALEATPVLASIGAPDRARRLLEPVIDLLPRGTARSAGLRRLAGLVEGDAGGGQRALALIDEALVEAGGDARCRAAALLDREQFERSNTSLEDALPIARRALEAAEESGDEELLAAAHVRTADLETVLGLADDPVARFRTALELGARVRVDAMHSAASMLAVCLIRAGRLDEARPYLRDERARAMAEGDEASFSQVSLFLAELEWLSGCWDAAATIALEGLEVAERAGARVPEVMDLILVALVEASRGDPGRARGLARRAIDTSDEIVERGYGDYARQALGFLELSLGDAAACAAHLATFRVGRGIEGPKRIAFIGDAIEALVRLGEIDQASTLTDEVTSRGRTLRRPPLVAIADRCRALVLAARGDLDGGLAAADAAVAAFQVLGQPFEHARALLVLGDVQRRAKKRRAARETLAGAIASFDRLGAHLWSKRAEAERARIGGRSTIEGLSETEARVAALVAEGKSNKEVAAELFVTVRAVEANLSKIYAKLGIRSRTELARRV